MLPCVGEEFGLGDLAAGHDDRGDCLDPACVGQPDHGGLGHRLVGVKDVLDLAGGDQDAPGVDDVLHPVDDGEIAVGVAYGEVAGVEPAVAEGLGGLLRLVPVALAQLRRAVDDLAAFAVGHVPALLVDHLRLDEQHRAPAGVHAALVLLGAENHRQRADLALPEAVVEGEVRQPFPEPFEDGHRHDRRPVVGLAQSAEVAGGEVGAAGQADPHGGRGEEAVRAARFDQVEEQVTVGGVEQDVLGADGQVGQQEDVRLGRVVERQRVHGAVAGLEVEGGDRAEVLVHQRAVGHHRALGQRGGAGGVEELHEVLGARLGTVVGLGRREPGEQGVTAVAVPAVPAVPAALGVLGVLAQRQDARALGQSAGEVRIGEDEGAAGLGDEVGEVLAGEGVVHRYVDESGAGAGEEGDQIGVGVVSVGADPVAVPESGVEQRAGAPADRVVEGGVGPVPVPVVEGDAFGGAAGAAPQHPVDGGTPAGRAPRPRTAAAPLRRLRHFRHALSLHPVRSARDPHVRR